MTNSTDALGRGRVHRSGTTAGALVRGTGWGGVCLAAAWTAGGGPAARGQESSELITTALPFPTYYYIPANHYGHRLGKVQMHYGASLASSFTDNRNLTSANQESDLGVTARVNVGGLYDINERQKLQIDLGIGYSWWLESNARDGLSIAPSTHIDYFFNLGDVRISLANNSSTSASAVDRYEYAGGDGTGGNQDLAFMQFVNNTSVGAQWAVNRVMMVNGSYSFGVTQSLNDQFQDLNSFNHSFALNPTWRVTTPLSLGVFGNYSMTTYQEQIQNDGQSVSAGGSASWNPTDYLNIDLRVGWMHSFFDRTGTIQDDSEYNGPTYSLSVRHQINKLLTHQVTSSLGANAGYQSNFTDSMNVSYQLMARLRRFTPVLNFSYARFSQSGTNGEDGDLYRLGLSTGYQLLRQLNLGLTYGLNFRDSDIAAREYTENTASINLTYTF